MKTTLIAAWVVAEGIVIYRAVKKSKRPPFPGELVWSSGLFVMLAILSEWQETLAALLAWGFVAAAFLNLAPAVLAGQQQAQAVAAQNKTGG